MVSGVWVGSGFHGYSKDFAGVSSRRTQGLGFGFWVLGSDFLGFGFGFGFLGLGFWVLGFGVWGLPEVNLDRTDSFDWNPCGAKCWRYVWCI